MSSSTAECLQPPNREAPSDRGRLLFAEDVVHLLNGRVTEWWVRRNVAPKRKIRLSHSRCAWYEQDVHAWIYSRMGAAA